MTLIRQLRPNGNQAYTGDGLVHGWAYTGKPLDIMIERELMLRSRFQ